MLKDRKDDDDLPFDAEGHLIDPEKGDTVPKLGEYPDIPPGEYIADFINDKEIIYKEWGPKLHAKFQIYGGDYDGTIIYNNYNFPKKMKSRHKYSHDWKVANRGSLKANGGESTYLPRGIFRGKRFKIKVRRANSKTIEYSVIDHLISLIPKEPPEEPTVKQFQNIQENPGDSENE
jgi:hypothetical protein